MNTAELEIGDFNVQSFIQKDPFGLCFSGVHRSSGKGMLILGLIPLEGRPITLDRLNRALASARSAEAHTLAEVHSLAEITSDDAEALLSMARESEPQID